MSELPLWTEELGRVLLAADSNRAAVGPDANGEVYSYGNMTTLSRNHKRWRGGSVRYVGCFALPPGREWHTLLVTREQEKLSEVMPTAADVGKPVLVRNDTRHTWSGPYTLMAAAPAVTGMKKRFAVFIHDPVNFDFWEFAKLASPPEVTPTLLIEEVERLRQTNTRLNRRVQEAESVIAKKGEAKRAAEVKKWIVDAD